MIDLRTKQIGGTWVRSFGSHEQEGYSVSTNNLSAHVSMLDLDLLFAVDRADVPAAWGEPIDTVALQAELIDAVVRKMTPGVFKELLREFRTQHQRAFRNGEYNARSKIREALGL